jgi:benzoyl-CoA reductase/2-hydroxyglutaryl-CoA dehydratase subunit BcrC/BadD/HgdB
LSLPVEKFGAAFMTHFSPPPRRQYLQQQKSEHDRHLFGVFPAQYPKEIFWAFNALPVEIWDPPLEISHADAHLQPYICSVVRSGLELILQGHGDILDGFLFPHTCDSIQNLASIVSDYLGLNKSVYFFYHPKAPYRDCSREYYLERLKKLAVDLEQQLGPLDPTELKMRVEQGQQVAAILRELYRLRAKGELGVANAEFYRVIRQGEYLHPDDFLALLEKFLAAAKSPPSLAGPAVILSGVLPNPPQLLDLLDQLGVRVTDDDLLACSRRLPDAPVSTSSPYESLADSYFALPPCTTKASAVEARCDHLLEKIKRSNAGGVIFCMVKFCEPELFDVPLVIEALKQRRLATLVLDTEINQGLSGQMQTRIEAFVEILERG